MGSSGWEAQGGERGTGWGMNLGARGWVGGVEGSAGLGCRAGRG